MSPSRSSTASWAPVLAPDGTAARPTVPSPGAHPPRRWGCRGYRGFRDHGRRQSGRAACSSLLPRVPDPESKTRPTSESGPGVIQANRTKSAGSGSRLGRSPAIRPTQPIPELGSDRRRDHSIRLLPLRTNETGGSGATSPVRLRSQRIRRPAKPTIQLIKPVGVMVASNYQAYALWRQPLALFEASTAALRPSLA